MNEVVASRFKHPLAAKMKCGEHLAAAVDHVLMDREALELFTKWARKRDETWPEAILLYFAIKQFRSKCEQKPEQAPALAIAAHKKYISLKTGSCAFLASSVREEMSRRAHSLSRSILASSSSSSNHDQLSNFFEPLVQPLKEHLRLMHAKFISSSTFRKFCSKIDDEPKPSTSEANTPRAEDKPRADSKVKSEPRCADSSSTSSPSFSSVPISLLNSTSGPTTVSAINSINSPTVCKTDAVSASSLVSSTTAATTNPFKTFKISSLQVGLESTQMVVPLARHHNEESRRTFFSKLEDKLEDLRKGMVARGIEFARDLPRDKEHEDELEEILEQDIGDYADRLAEKKSRSPSPPSVPLTSPPPFPPSHVYSALNSFAPPPSSTSSSTAGRRNRRRVAEDFAPSLQSPTSGPAHATKIRFSRSSAHDSASSGFHSSESCYLGPSSNSTGGFFPRSMGMHFNTLTRPAHHSHSFGERSTAFSSLSSGASDSRGYVPATIWPGWKQQDCFERKNAAAFVDTSPLLSSTAFPVCATLPRPSKKVSAESTQNSAEKKVLLKLLQNGSRPMVFRLEEETAKSMTLKQFRAIFAISSQARKKFFFKSVCDDGSADYQWEHVADDSATVPIFLGSVTAECRDEIDSP